MKKKRELYHKNLLIILHTLHYVFIVITTRALIL